MIGVGEIVELTEAVAGCSAGTRGGVVEVRSDDWVTVELLDQESTTPILDRLVDVPLKSLTLVGRASEGATTDR